MKSGNQILSFLWSQWVFVFVFVLNHVDHHLFQALARDENKYTVFPTFSEPVLLIFLIYTLSVACLNLTCLSSKRKVVLKTMKEVRMNIPGPLDVPDIVSAVAGGICTVEEISQCSLPLCLHWCDQNTHIDICRTEFLLSTLLGVYILLHSFTMWKMTELNCSLLPKCSSGSCKSSIYYKVPKYLHQTDSTSAIIAQWERQTLGASYSAICSDPLPRSFLSELVCIHES